MPIDYNNPAYGTWIGGAPKSASSSPSSPLQFTTSRDAGNNLSTATPGYTGAPPQDQGFGDVISKILQNRQQARVAAPQQAAPMQLTSGAAIPRYQEAPQQYTPEFGAAPVGPDRSGDVITRTVHDPRQSPFAKMATGLEPTPVVEKGYRRKDGSIEWEFDSERPHGSSGGIIGGGMNNPSTLHSTSMEGGLGPITPPDMTSAGTGAAPGATTTDTGLTKASQAAAQAKKQKDQLEGRRIPARTWDFS